VVGQCAAGILTMRGGMTSHAAVIARGMGKSAVTGACASGLRLFYPAAGAAPAAAAVAPHQPFPDWQEEEARARLCCCSGGGSSGELVLKSGDMVTIDGDSGVVYNGTLPMVRTSTPRPPLLRLAHACLSLSVR